MAKKKTEEQEVSVESSDDIQKRIIKEIEKDLGKGVIISGNELIERPKMVIPVCPAINQITGGGIPEGSWVILSGKEKAGKTVTALHFAAKCQRPEYGSRNVYFLNVEGRLKKRDLKGVPGLKVDGPGSMKIIESTEDKILTTEDYLSIASNILYSDKKCVIIIDSVSQLCEERVQVGGVGTQTRGSGGILVSQFTSQMGPVVNVKNSIVVCILQHRANTSGYGSANLEKGGRAIQYQVDVKLVVQGSPEPTAKTKGGEPYGQKVTWQCTATGLNFPPNRKCESYIRYGEGIDEASELINDAVDMDLINSTSNGHLTLNYLANHIEELGLKEWNENVITEIGAKAHGIDNMREVFKNNPKWMELLEKDISQYLS